ncbi:antibiotic biosynthesis monooxygenase [Amycolatopsis rubida]|uniref:Antibiotic biosynthesis monooxygenase n=1 Tax=Amycolatopsis rubida TaxID=112413 RepID=A0A1I5MZD3_9PSEU|nr:MULTISPECIES: antibiotic biosynthesis monooxygenase family protein [Amycolatopsis]MYW92751.1 antibiotic biosynthesis monooxygenase [Amycolatopsis rubida]NEC57737.1 antibiotic biosynthesis monooxygenase [Amycolatopsis rubida]OAP24895.1 Tetracenomycin-F1 monooxygenase [Amycolatopsis sp. M39]SFP14752.1 Antibiotic biosynthesis monooxygenase [Amycolatopsis rubida]
MTTISTDADVVTLVNVFTVAPEKQQALIKVLTTATEEAMSHQAGYVSANIHASTDGTRVVNYSQWASADAFHAMTADPECREHMSAALALAECDPHLYTVESVHHI